MSHICAFSFFARLRVVLVDSTIAQIAKVHANVLLGLAVLLGATMDRCRSRVHRIVQ